MAKPKVTLIRPLIKEYINSQSSDNFESSIGLVPPLNLCCLGAALEDAEIEVSIYDCEANNNNVVSLEEFLAAEMPDVVGISIITTNFRGALYTAAIARRILPNAKIICGGTHMMIFPLETLSHPEFDYGFIGEAEGPLVDFLNILKNGSNDFKQINGLVWRSGKDIIVNEPFGFNRDLDSLPYPAYHLLRLSAYRMPNAKDNVVSLFLSRGCPFNCSFCFRNPQLKKVRFKSVNRIIDEIGYMVERFSVSSINFVDETISLNKEYFLEFCDRLAAKKWNLEWQSPTRVSSIDEDIVGAAKKAGCHTFRLGIESGSEVILKKINKNISIKDTLTAVSLCRKYGIKTVGYFIIGYLGETKETVKQTINFAIKLSPDFVAFFPATPMPATKLCLESEQALLIPKDYWRDFVIGNRHDALPFIFPDADKWTSLAYKRFYFSPSYIIRQIKYIKSFEDLLNKIKIAYRLFYMKFKRGSS